MESHKPMTVCFGVAVHSYNHAGLDSIDDVNKIRLSQLEQFFISYNKQRRKEFRVNGGEKGERQRRISSVAEPPEVVGCIMDGDLGSRQADIAAFQIDTQN